MGCPDIYYKEALKTFLLMFNNKMVGVEDECMLEHEISIRKSIASEKEFYYNAGRAYEHVINLAIDKYGCDEMNACIGGLVEFERLIGY